MQENATQRSDGQNGGLLVGFLLPRELEQDREVVCFRASSMFMRPELRNLGRLR
jgi:hypothetical protein